MRKFIPRLLNIICFACACVMAIPFTLLAKGLDYASRHVAFLGFLATPSEFVNNVLLPYEGLKLFIIPAALIAISVLFLIIASIDRGVKKHDKKASRPLSNMVVAPLYYLGISVSLVALVAYSEGFFGAQPLYWSIQSTDWFGLGAFLQLIPGLNVHNYAFFFGVIFYGALFVIQLILALSMRKNYKRGFGGRFFKWLLFAILAFVSLKGVTDIWSPEMNVANFASAAQKIEYSYDGVNINMLDHCLNITNFKDCGGMLGGFTPILGEPRWFASGLVLAGILLITGILYIIIGAVRCHKNNVAMRAEKEDHDDDMFADQEPAVLPDPELVNGEITDPVFVLPRPEEILAGAQEEEPADKQVIYENHDLDQIFATEFGFKNTTMVRAEGYTDYFVNKQKFLTISNGQKTISFRLQLDKAIRLIIQYPLVAKDKYENHKIWFKVDDISVLNKDTVIAIIRDAYVTVLNND